MWLTCSYYLQFSSSYPTFPISLKSSRNSTSTYINQQNAVRLNTPGILDDQYSRKCRKFRGVSKLRITAFPYSYPGLIRDCCLVHLVHIWSVVHLVRRSTRPRTIIISTIKLIVTRISTRKWKYCKLKYQYIAWHIVTSPVMQQHTFCWNRGFLLLFASLLLESARMSRGMFICDRLTKLKFFSFYGGQEKEEMISKL